MLTTLTFALYPNRVQTARLFHFLRVGRLTYNRCLEARKHWYAKSGRSLSYYDACADLTALRNADQFWRGIPLEILRDGTRRADLAYKHFFRRLKERKAGKRGRLGFPRFKSARRWNGFSVAAEAKVIVNGRVQVPGVGSLIRARNVRAIVGKAKQLRVVHRAGRWFAKVVVDDGQSPPPLVPVKSAVGIDLGLKCFAVLSNGERIENPRFGDRMARKIRGLHRSVSRKRKGSGRRRKALTRLQRAYGKLADLRSNFVHHAAKRVIRDHQLIAVENLNVASMVRGRFGRSILDACWSQFIWGLTYRAEIAGGQVLKVNPAGTSQECCECGRTVQKDLSVRVHWCPCGAMLDRDENAARVILARALKRPVSAGQHPRSVGPAVTLAEGPASSRRHATAVKPTR